MVELRRNQLTKLAWALHDAEETENVEAIKRIFARIRELTRSHNNWLKQVGV